MQRPSNNLAEYYVVLFPSVGDWQCDICCVYRGSGTAIKILQRTFHSVEKRTGARAQIGLCQPGENFRKARCASWPNRLDIFCHLLWKKVWSTALCRWLQAHGEGHATKITMVLFLFVSCLCMVVWSLFTLRLWVLSGLIYWS